MKKIIKKILGMQMAMTLINGRVFQDYHSIYVRNDNLLNQQV